MLRHAKMGTNENIVPSWVGKEDARVLATIFLLTEWDEQKDKDLVVGLSRMDYAEFLKNLTKLKAYEDTPIRSINGTWQLVSKSDFWSYIEEHLDDEILNEFKFVAQVALVDDDTSFELIPEKRWLAPLEGKGASYSSRVKAGISNSLALLAFW